MVTSPKIDVLRFVFLKLPRAKGKMDIYLSRKMSKKGGSKRPPVAFVDFLAFGILNEIFLAGLYLKHHLANARTPDFTFSVF